jgi:hypothetical protein
MLVFSSKSFVILAVKFIYMVFLEIFFLHVVRGIQIGFFHMSVTLGTAQVVEMTAQCPSVQAKQCPQDPHGSLT